MPHENITPGAFRDELNTREDARETGSDLRPFPAQDLRWAFHRGPGAVRPRHQATGGAQRFAEGAQRHRSGVTSGTSVLSEGWSVVGVIPG